MLDHRQRIPNFRWDEEITNSCNNLLASEFRVCLTYIWLKYCVTKYDDMLMLTSYSIPNSSAEQPVLYDSRVSISKLAGICPPTNSCLICFFWPSRPLLLTANRVLFAALPRNINNQPNRRSCFRFVYGKSNGTKVPNPINKSTSLWKYEVIISKWTKISPNNFR